MKRSIKRWLIDILEGLAVAVLIVMMTLFVIVAICLVPTLLIKAGLYEYAIAMTIAEVLLVYALYAMVVTAFEDEEEDTPKQSPDNE
jgi:hypothetical protein